MQILKQLLLVDYQMQVVMHATLTVAVRRSKLSSKEKSLTRCNSLTINRSALTG